MKHFNGLPLATGIKLIRHILSEQERQRAWDMWLTKFVGMSKDNFVPFSKFYEAISTDIEPKPHKSAAELLAEAEQIRKRIEAGYYKDGTI